MQYAPKVSSRAVSSTLLQAAVAASYESHQAPATVSGADEMKLQDAGSSLSQHLSLDPFMRNYLSGAMMQRVPGQDSQPSIDSAAESFADMDACADREAGSADVGGADFTSLGLARLIAGATGGSADSCMNFLRPDFSTSVDHCLSLAGTDLWTSSLGAMDSLVNGAALAAAAARIIAAHPATPSTTPAVVGDDGSTDGREKAIVRLCERFPIDDRAKNKLRGLPELLRKRIIKEFRPGPVANGDYSRALMGFLNGFPETRDYPEVPPPISAAPQIGESQLRNALALLGGALGRSSGVGSLLPGPRWRAPGKANDRVLLKGGNALSQSQLETFRKKYPMEDRAMEYLRTASPEVQEQCVGTFRIRERLDDFTQAIIAHVRACRMITGDRTPPPPEVPLCNTSAAQQIIALAEFRSRYPFDDRTLQYMQQAGVEVMNRVMCEFQPPRGGVEKDFSKSITAFVRRCKEEGERKLVPDMAQDDLAMLNEFRSKYNFDERCLDYIKQSNAEVRRRVLTEFQPPRGGVEGDYSKSITAFVRRCKEDDKRRCQEDEKKNPTPEMSCTQGTGNEITNLAEFRQKFPFDDRAFDYIQQCRPEVRQRVLTEFKPSLSGSTKDYSKSITAFVRRCKEEDIRRCREAATMFTSSPGEMNQVDENERKPKKEKAFAWMDSGDELSSGPEDRSPAKKPKVELTTEEALEDFRRRFPMDAMAFDFLCRSPKSVRHRVLKEFRPSDRGANDNYSKQLTCFVRSCLKDAHGTGSILPSAKRTMGSFSMM